MQQKNLGIRAGIHAGFQARIQLAEGNGGAENAALIEEIFLKNFADFMPFGGEDAGFFGGDFEGKNGAKTAKKSRFESKKTPTPAKNAQNAPSYAISTDSYTITPLFFPGGDIGKLSVCGSCNDVAVSGARPRFLSLSFIIEEGFLKSDLEKIAASMAREIAAANLAVLSADTKVVPKGAASGIFINTTAIGEVVYGGLGARHLRPGDAIILSAPIAAHGACVYCLRNDLRLEAPIQSDCANLWAMLEPLFGANLAIHALRDATRGGLAAVLNEWASSSGCDICVRQKDIIVPEAVRGICEILGIEPYSLANEGVCVIALPKAAANAALEILRATNLGQNAAIIGEVGESGGFGGDIAAAEAAAGAQKTAQNGANGAEKCGAKAPVNGGIGGTKWARKGRVIMQNAIGLRRILEYPEGEILPRIC